MTLYLSEADVQQVLTIQDTLDAVEASLREQGLGVATNLSRARLRAPRSFPAELGTPPAPARSLLNLMGGALPGHGIMGFKAYSATPTGTHFQVFLYSFTNGEMIALIEGGRIGQARTGAASGIATKYMAREDASTLGVYGTGFQARGQVEAICAVRPIRRITAYGRDRDRLTKFCEEMQTLTGVETVPAAAPEDVARGADIVVTITSAREPVLEGAWLEPGTHINAAGSNSILRREIDDEVIRRSARVVIDSIEQGKIECGDLIAPIERGVVTWAQVRELGEVVVGRSPGRTNAEEITLFESHGLTLWDLATAHRVYEKATAAGLGQQLPF